MFEQEWVATASHSRPEDGYQLRRVNPKDTDNSEFSALAHQIDSVQATARSLRTI